MHCCGCYPRKKAIDSLGGALGSHLLAPQVIRYFLTYPESLDKHRVRAPTRSLPIFGSLFAPLRGMSPRGADTDTLYLVDSATFLVNQEIWYGTNRPTNGKFFDLRVRQIQSAPLQTT
jgi:hypothetical protein